ncbi:signal peptidase II [Bacterioplanoides pacificum]|uniref:Lipoprotein signal peptidase n=1 Tax=Bacterioplanoides pacificum TaxID=1171596 RepID=A0ABV7VYW6_9GAMM
MMTQQRSALIWLWLALAVFVLDIATKQIAEALLSYGKPVYLLPVLDFTLLYNRGAAFSFLANESGWQRWFFTAISLGVSAVLVVWLKKLPRTQVWLPVALTLILGGALGNLFDRLVYGHVIDFISVHWQQSYFPAFNLADSAITVGAIMMAIDVVLEGKREAQQKAS